MTKSGYPTWSVSLELDYLVHVGHLELNLLGSVFHAKLGLHHEDFEDVADADEDASTDRASPGISVAASDVDHAAGECAGNDLIHVRVVLGNVHQQALEESEETHPRREVSAEQRGSFLDQFDSADELGSFGSMPRA